MRLWLLRNSAAFVEGHIGRGQDKTTTISYGQGLSDEDARSITSTSTSTTTSIEEKDDESSPPSSPDSGKEQTKRQAKKLLTTVDCYNTILQQQDDKHDSPRAKIQRLPVRPGKAECQFFVKSGRCAFGMK